MDAIYNEGDAEALLRLVIASKRLPVRSPHEKMCPTLNNLMRGIFFGGLTNGALISDEKKNYVALKDVLMAFFRPNILQYSSESNAPGQFHRLT